MRKTSVYLSDQEAEQLKQLSVRDGRPQAELIREGVRHVIAEAGAERRQYRSLGKGRGGGEPYQPWRSKELYERSMGTKKR
jgi:Arc/MetJ-type ribon-helix-helix transcriptional regulator